MQRDLVIEKLTPLFRDVFENDDIEIRESLKASDIPEWDSLSNVRLFVAIEMAFAVRFTTAEITGFQNVGQIINDIIKKVG